MHAGIAVDSKFRKVPEAHCRGCVRIIPLTLLMAFAIYFCLMTGLTNIAYGA